MKEMGIVQGVGLNWGGYEIGIFIKGITYKIGFMEKVGIVERWWIMNILSKISRFGKRFR